MKLEILGLILPLASCGSFSADPEECEALLNEAGPAVQEFHRALTNFTSLSKKRSPTGFDHYSSTRNMLAVLYRQKKEGFRDPKKMAILGGMLRMCADVYPEHQAMIGMMTELPMFDDQKLLNKVMEEVKKGAGNSLEEQLDASQTESLLGEYYEEIRAINQNLRTIAATNKEWEHRKEAGFDQVRQDTQAKLRTQKTRANRQKQALYR